MNLRNHQPQPFQGILDVLSLSEHNRELAEQYLDMEEPENRTLLENVEHQCFSKLPDEFRRKSCEYLKQIRKQEKTEEAGRYIRLVTKIGGSTARFLLISYGHDSDYKYLEQFLEPDEILAIRAENLVWYEYRLREEELRPLLEAGRNHPENLVQAMKLCNRSDAANSKMLLAAIYLHNAKPLDRESGDGTPLTDEQKQVQEIVEYLEARLVNNVELLFDSSNRPDGADLKKIRAFERESDPKEPFSPELSSIVFGKNASCYSIKFHSSCAFLAIEHSRCITNHLRLAIALDEEKIPNRVLSTCCDVAGKQWFYRHIEILENVLPISKETYVRWCISREEKEILLRISHTFPDAICQILSDAPALECGYLLACLRKDNPDFYAKLDPALLERYRTRIAQDHVENYEPSKNQAERYLLGQAELLDILPYVKEWRDQDRWPQAVYSEAQINSLLECGEAAMYKRAIVLQCLRLRMRYLSSNWILTDPDTMQKNLYNKLMDEQQGRAVIKILEEEKVPVLYQMDFLGTVYSSFYQEEGLTDGEKLGVKLLSEQWDKWNGEFMSSVKDSIMAGRILAVLVMDSFGNTYKKELLSMASDSSKQVREYLQAIYVKHEEWEDDILLMLKSKKGGVREMAVQVLRVWGAEKYQELIVQALAAEKTKKIKELMQAALTEAGQTTEQSEEMNLEKLAEEILTGGRKRILSWFLKDDLPKVHKKDGKEASEDYLSAILVAYADMRAPGINTDASKLTGELVLEEFSAYVECLFTNWLDSGAEAKKKWVLYAAAIHGSGRIVPILYAQIQEWPKALRGAMAAEAVRALALRGTSDALLLVDQISRRFKFRQVKNAAASALTYAAEQLGMTRAELEDRIVPNLGFDDRMERVFDYGTRRFRVILTSALELEIYSEDGKRLKNLPSPGKKDDSQKAKASADAFKLLKKQLKMVVSTQKLRLEQALSSERSWSVNQWKDLFVKNPVMHQFAMGLIWGMYKDGKLTDTFRYMEDGTFNTVEEDEYELPESGTIGLVHPLELDADTLSTWKEQLSDYELTQPIEQLERPVYRITEEEKEQKELTRFGGKLINGLSLSGKLKGQGWYRGSVQDAGGYDTFYREDGEMGVELEFSGCFVGGENEEVTVYGAQFYKAGTVKRGSYVYDTVKEQHRYRLSEVSPRYFSEIVLQLTKATASSQEQLSYPECKERR